MKDYEVNFENPGSVLPEPSDIPNTAGVDETEIMLMPLAENMADKYDMIIYTDFDDTLIAKSVGMTNNRSVEPIRGAFFPPAQAFLARQLSNNERSFHIKVISTGGDAAHQIRPLFITAFGEETVQALEARDALSFLGPSEINAYYSDRELPDEEIKAQIINEHRPRGASAIYLDDDSTYFCVMMSRYARNQSRGFCMPILVPKIQAPLRDIELPNFHHFHLADLMIQGYIYPEQTFLQLRAYATEYLHAENHEAMVKIAELQAAALFDLLLQGKNNLTSTCRQIRPLRLRILSELLEENADTLKETFSAYLIKFSNMPACKESFYYSLQESLYACILHYQNKSDYIACAEWIIKLRTFEDEVRTKTTPATPFWRAISNDSTSPCDLTQIIDEVTTYLGTSAHPDAKQLSRQIKGEENNRSCILC